MKKKILDVLEGCLKSINKAIEKEENSVKRKRLGEIANEFRVLIGNVDADLSEDDANREKLGQIVKDLTDLMETVKKEV